jgi:hypothetical protein
MRPTLLLVLAFCLAMPFLGCAATSTGKASLLYVGLGKSGRMVPRGEGKDTYALTISEPGERITFFADRPVRMAGTLPLKDFVKLWEPGRTFHSDPPNVALAFGDNGHVLVAELSEPRIDGKDLSFQARLVSHCMGKKGEGKPDKALLPERFGEVALFYDDVPIAGDGGFSAGYNQVPMAQTGAVPDGYDQVPMADTDSTPDSDNEIPMAQVTQAPHGMSQIHRVTSSGQSLYLWQGSQ